MRIRLLPAFLFLASNSVSATCPAGLLRGSSSFTLRLPPGGQCRYEFVGLPQSQLVLDQGEADFSIEVRASGSPPRLVDGFEFGTETVTLAGAEGGRVIVTRSAGMGGLA